MGAVGYSSFVHSVPRKCSFTIASTVLDMHRRLKKCAPTQKQSSVVITMCGVPGFIISWSHCFNSAHAQFSTSSEDLMCPLREPTNHNFFPSIIFTYVQNPEESECASEYEHSCPAKPHNVVFIGGVVRQLKNLLSFRFTLPPSSSDLCKSWVQVRVYTQSQSYPIGAWPIRNVCIGMSVMLTQYSLVLL